MSWLGLLTHKEKVDAILLLDELKNCHDLQVFLGMMVYFSTYIPFYAWITGPLFNLLKSNVKWEWTKVHSEAFELCNRFSLMCQFISMQNQDILTDYIWMLAILD